uniref:33.6 kDa small heat shock protein n=1 Tax=Choristoneura fumiferana TaxID=7141 RepID=Q1AMF4_CHOFU|nr:33.6 kDa small heat shock protein [Choristoneura fumiferana]
MYKYFALTILVLACVEARKHHHQDPFAALDQQLSHSLAFHYLWPWSELMQAAAAMNEEDNLEEPQITADPNRFEIKINVKRFKPEELRIKVKNQYIVVEGRHKTTATDNRFMANHFVQRFNLPPGSKQEEVTAVLNEKGVLIVSAPRHEVPPPPAERIVPIEVRLPQAPSERPSVPSENPIEASSERVENSSEKIETSSEKIETSSEKAEILSEAIENSSEKVEISSEKVEVSSESPYRKPSSESPLVELHMFDKSHVGKIRKKELKNTTKHVKDNEVSKGVNGNLLDYALIEAEE